MLKLNAKELRGRKPTPQELASLTRRALYIVVDNVLDTYNIGGLFRLADAAAGEIILCGESETPPSSRIHKAAVGTEEWVAWRYEPTAQIAISKIKNQNAKTKIIAVEQSEKSVPYTKLNELLVTSYESPVAVVVGHETEGVDKSVLEMADQVVEIPMFGANRSLNVIVSAAIVVYEILKNLRQES